MRRAHYELLSDEGKFYGEIPSLPGVYATADTLEACREELAEVLEEWILVRISKHLPIELQRDFDELGKHPEMTDVEYMLPAVLEKDEQEQESCSRKDLTQRRKDAKRKDT